MKEGRLMIKRTTFIFIIIALFVVSLGLSQKFLAVFNLWITNQVQEIAFTALMALIWITVLRLIYKPMSSLVRKIINSSSLLDIKALAFYRLVLLFSFALYTLFFSITGLLIYLIFG